MCLCFNEHKYRINKARSPDSWYDIQVELQLWSASHRPINVSVVHFVVAPITTVKLDYNGRLIGNSIWQQRKWPWMTVQHFTRFQLTVCSHGSFALAELLVGAWCNKFLCPVTFWPPSCYRGYRFYLLGKLWRKFWTSCFFLLRSCVHVGYKQHHVTSRSLLGFENESLRPVAYSCYFEGRVSIKCTDRAATFRSVFVHFGSERCQV